MRRKDKEIKDIEVIERIILESFVCRIAMTNNNKPYIVPMSFGYNDNCLYFHSALKGKKIDWLNENPEICFEIEGNLELVQNEVPCEFGVHFASIIGTGKVVFIEEPEEKIKCLNHIMAKYSKKKFQFKESQVKSVAVFKVEIEEIAGKKSG